MLNILSSTNNAPRHLTDGGTILLYQGQLPSSISSFESCRSLSLWRNHYQPFAGIAINASSNEFILFRDHLGVAPLYYCNHHGKNLIVAQTIPEILQQLPSAPPLLENQINLLFSEHKRYSDETIYQGIYRVEPGHLMHFKSDGPVVKQAFWQLEPHGSMLHYKDPKDYLDHFSILMNEAILNATENQTNIAAEFSAGLDSSAIVCAAANIMLTPKLYMHVARPGSTSADRYNDRPEKAFIEHYQLIDIQRIGADNFDPIEVFNEYASWFAGPAPYLFHMFANPLHRAVAAKHHPILLSGFGGDQCISGQIPRNFFLPELINQGEYGQAWRELRESHGVKKAMVYAQHLHPSLYATALKIKTIKRQMSNALRKKSAHQSTLIHPYERMCYPSVRQTECSLLQGPDSHEVRMRIEYSSIVSNKMGFEYRYPLLYPKLLEFMLSVPTIEKRRDSRGRYLIRQYLSQFLPKNVFDTYTKKDGLGIVPSTFDLFQQKYQEGCYQEIFKDLSHRHLIQHKEQPIELRNSIKVFMLNASN